jgi:hypothetical protein
MAFSSLGATLVAAAALASAACAPTGQPTPPAQDAAIVTLEQQPHTSIFSSVTSDFDQPTELVVREQAAYEQVMRSAYGMLAGAESPAVDFARDMVIVVAMGQRNTVGYGSQIDEIGRDAAGLVVRYTVTSPGPEYMTTQMLTSPVEVVSTPRVAGQVRFERRQVTERC